MVQELNRFTEQLDNLDKVEPYGLTAEAQASSALANEYARMGAQIAPMLAQRSTDLAIEEARRLTFDRDPETGVPVLPEETRLGGLNAMRAYQQGVEERYENSLNQTLEEKLKRLEIQFWENEEGFRQASAIEIGAMAGKVDEKFIATFDENASYLNSDISIRIASRVAARARAEARAASRRNAARRYRNSTKKLTASEAEEVMNTQLADDINTMLTDPDNPVSPEILTKDAYDATREQRKEVMEGTTGNQPSPEMVEGADPAVTADVEATNANTKKVELDFDMSTQTGRDGANRLTTMVSEPELAFQVWQDQTDGQVDVVVEATLGPAATTTQWWSNPTNLQDLNPVDEFVLTQMEDTGRVPEAVETGFNALATGNLPVDKGLVWVENYMRFGGMSLPNTGYASDNPDEAAKIHHIAQTFHSMDPAILSDPEALKEEWDNTMDRIKAAESKGQAELNKTFNVRSNASDDTLHQKISDEVRVWATNRFGEESDVLNNVDHWARQVRAYVQYNGGNTKSAMKAMMKLNVKSVNGGVFAGADGNYVNELKSTHIPNFAVADKSNPHTVLHDMVTRAFNLKHGTDHPSYIIGLHMLDDGKSVQVVLNKKLTPDIFPVSEFQRLVRESASSITDRAIELGTAGHEARNKSREFTNLKREYLQLTRIPNRKKTPEHKERMREILAEISTFERSDDTSHRDINHSVIIEELPDEAYDFVTKGN